MVHSIETLETQLSHQTIGTGEEVVCDNCLKPIEEGSEVEFYAAGSMSIRGYKIHQVSHPDCGTIKPSGEATMEDDIWGEAVVVHDENIRDDREDEEDIKERYRDMLGIDVEVVQSDKHPQHRLDDITITKRGKPGESPQDIEDQ